MNHRPDSAQIIAALGTSAGFMLANFDRFVAAACGLVGLAYTIWKWRKEANRHANRRLGYRQVK